MQNVLEMAVLGANAGQETYLLTYLLTYLVQDFLEEGAKPIWLSAAQRRNFDQKPRLLIVTSQLTCWVWPDVYLPRRS